VRSEKGDASNLMAIVAGHFATILRPGLRKVWAGVYFKQKGQLYVPITTPTPTYARFLSYIVEGVFWGPMPFEFDDWDDYLIAKAEWSYDALD